MDAPYQFEKISNLLRVLIINGCWILSSAFSVSVDIIIQFFFFSLLIWYIYLFSNVWPLHIPRKIILLVMVYIILFVHYWIWSANISLSISWVHERYWCAVSFFYCLCLVSVSGNHWPHKRSWEVWPPLLFSRRNCIEFVLVP